MKQNNLYLRSLLAAVLFSCIIPAFALGKRETKTVWVGETFTVYPSTHPRLVSVLWEWDFGALDLISSSDFSATFKAREATPAEGVIIQAIIYYFPSEGSITTGKFFDDWTIHVEDNSTVSLDRTKIELSVGESFTINATASSGYSGKYRWSSSNSSVATCSSSSSRATVRACAAGRSTIMVTLDNDKSAQCEVNVKDVDVESVTVSDVTVQAEKGTEANMSVYPTNGTIKSILWGVSEGEDIVSVSSSGYVTGLNPGTAKIYCTVNGKVRSNDATVTVTEPRLAQSSSVPKNSATGVSPFVTPSVTYSLDIFKGDGWGDVCLKEGGTNVAGMVTIKGNELSFRPAKPLKPLTAYTLSVPRNAVQNKWGSAAQSSVSLSFTTADYEKASVTMSPASGTFLTSMDRITLTAEPSDAKIYYTLDGKEPTTESARYTAPLQVDGDVVVKAMAVREGYKNSDVVTGEYYKSQSEVMRYYPNDASPLFVYDDATPHVKFSGGVEKSNNFRRISLTTAKGEAVAGEALLTYDLLAFVPDEPLKHATTYTMDIPRDALKAGRGEVFRGFSWSFTTPALPAKVGMQGDEAVYVLSENGLLRTRGMDYQTVASDDGSYTYIDYQTLTDQQADVESIACGYTHRLVKSGSGVAGYGLAYCGETGTQASISAIGGIQSVKAGFQTSAIIGEDGALWMCGRNDFYQLCDSTGTTAKAFVKVAEHVTDVALGNGFTLYVDADHGLWAVGRNHRGQLGDGTKSDRKRPVKVMEDVAKVYASAGGFFSACITTDGKLWTWGDNADGQLGREAGKYSSTPAVVMDGVAFASLGEAHVLALTEDSKLYAWGSNAYGQIGEKSGNITQPALMAEGIRDVAAGPHTSLIVTNNGKVAGWGQKSHHNFGEGVDDARDYVVCEGYAYDTLRGVTMDPVVFEAEPDSRFALVAMPVPFTADYESVEWFSANPDVASVEGNGIIRTQSIGETTVTVRFTDKLGMVKESTSKIVCTENPDNTDVASVADDTSWSVRAHAGTIFVEDAVIGATYTVYSLQGIAMAQCRAATGSVMFKVKQPGVYLVRSGSKTVKVSCR